MKNKASLAILICILGLPFMALAQNKILPEQPDGGYGICDVLKLVNSIVDIVVKGIIPLIATLILAWAGFRVATNQGDADVAKQTKTIFMAVAIGLVIMFAAYAIVGSILVSMGYATSAFNWAPKCE